MNKKNFSQIKKIFLIIIFFSGIFFNSQNIFAENNKKLDEKLSEILSEIKKLKIDKNLCPKEDIEKYKTIIGDNGEIITLPNNVYKNLNSESGIKKRDEFLEEYNTWGNSFQELLDGFTIQFSGNYCYQRDLKKINKLFYFSIEYGAKLAEKCLDTKDIKKYILDLKKIKDEFEDEQNGKSKFYLDNQKDLYYGEYRPKVDEKGNIIKGETSYYPPFKCKEDSITDAFKKIKELKETVSSIGSGSLTSASTFFSNIGKIWATVGTDKVADNDLYDFLKKIEDGQEKAAQNYVTSIFNKTRIDKDNNIWGKIYNTITWTSKKKEEEDKKTEENKKQINTVQVAGDINNFLTKNQTNSDTAKFANLATKFFEKDYIFNNLEEDATNQIVENLAGLETDIVLANGNYNEIGTDNTEIQTLKNFILKFSKFLDKHNETVGTVESNIRLTCDKKIDALYFK